MKRKQPLTFEEFKDIYSRVPRLCKDAVKRVAKEELGMNISIKKFLGYLEYFSEEQERGFGYAVALVFLCIPLQNKLKLDDQAEKAEFFFSPPKNMIKEQKEFLKNIKKPKQ